MTYVGKYGAIGAGGGGAGWFNPVAANTPAIAALHGQLYEVDLTTAGANVVITLPVPNAAGATYVGVSVARNTEGRSLLIQNQAAVAIETLYARGTVVWFAYNLGLAVWEVVSRELPLCDFSAQLNPLGAWYSDGADTDLADLSGNGRTLTKTATIARASGVTNRRTAASYLRGWSRVDAALHITGALTIELILRKTYNVSSTGSPLLSQNIGGGGVAANNFGYRIEDGNGPSSASMWGFRHGFGAANFANMLSNLYASFSWEHLVITRSAPSAGQQTVRCYSCGVLTGVALLTACDGGNPAVPMVLGGPVNYDFQFAQIHNIELTATQVAFLAAARFGGRDKA